MRIDYVQQWLLDFHSVFWFAFCGCVLWLMMTRSRETLEDWAKKQHFEIILREYRYFFRGPFFMTGPTVYYVKVRTESGSVRTGWVRVSFFSDSPEVRWES